jgi:hypothetical protein
MLHSAMAMRLLHLLNLPLSTGATQRLAREAERVSRDTERSLSTRQSNDRTNIQDKMLAFVRTEWRDRLMVLHDKTQHLPPPERLPPLPAAEELKHHLPPQDWPKVRCPQERGLREPAARKQNPRRQQDWVLEVSAEWGSHLLAACGMATRCYPPPLLESESPTPLEALDGTAQDGHQLHCTVSDTNNNW